MPKTSMPVLFYDIVANRSRKIHLTNSNKNLFFTNILNFILLSNFNILFSSYFILSSFRHLLQMIFGSDHYRSSTTLLIN